MDESYEAAMAVLTRATAWSCDHPERDVIEAHRTAGAPFTRIARILKQIGSIGGEVSPRSAARRVAIHFRDHNPDPVADRA